MRKFNTVLFLFLGLGLGLGLGLSLFLSKNVFATDTSVIDKNLILKQPSPSYYVEYLERNAVLNSLHNTNPRGGKHYAE